MKNLLITHTDLDGISPIILLNLTDTQFDYHSIEISEITNKFNELFESDLSNYETIYIVDLTIPKEIYEEINKRKLKVKVFDHHESHLYANEYTYTNVTVKLNNRLTCGTELFYEHLKKLYKNLNKPNIKEYVEHVRQLDTYTFESDTPRKIEGIRKLLGKNNFIKSITKRLRKNKEHFEFTAFENRYFKINQEEIERYLQSKEKELITYEIEKNKCGIVFAEQHKSDLGNYLSSKRPELDFIIIFDISKSISYRTIRDDVSVSNFAEIYNGGGHKKASGSPIDNEIRKKVIELYFKNTKCLDE